MNVSCALDPRSVSPLWCLSVYRSWAAQTSSSSTRTLRSTALTTTMCSCQSSYYPWCARYQGNFSSFNRTTPQHTGMRHCGTSRATPAFHQIFYQRTALTLIQLITGSGASSNSECTSRDSRVHDTDELKQFVQQEWRNVDQSIVDSAIDEWRKRLRACVQANGGYFEHML